MPRPTMTPAQRIHAVNVANISLTLDIAAAERASNAHGAGSLTAMSAWEVVEINAATIHRQSRILAGKSRGG